MPDSILVLVMQRWTRQADFLASLSLHYGGRRPTTKKINTWYDAEKQRRGVYSGCGGQAKAVWIRNIWSWDKMARKHHPPAQSEGQLWGQGRDQEWAWILQSTTRRPVWLTNGTSESWESAFKLHLSVLNSTTLWLHTVITRGSRCVTWGTDPGDTAGGISSHPLPSFFPLSYPPTRR